MKAKVKKNAFPSRKKSIRSKKKSRQVKNRKVASNSQPRGTVVHHKEAAAADTSTPSNGKNILNTSKLKEIFKVLAAEHVKSFVEKRDCCPKPTQHAVEKIFREENLKKIKKGLNAQSTLQKISSNTPFEADDDSDCCVIFSNCKDPDIEILKDFNSCTWSESDVKERPSKRKKSNEKSLSSSSEVITSVEKGSFRSSPGNIFDKEKLEKIREGIRNLKSGNVSSKEIMNISTTDLDENVSSEDKLQQQSDLNNYTMTECEPRLRSRSSVRSGRNSHTGDRENAASQVFLNRSSPNSSLFFDSQRKSAEKSTNSALRDQMIERLTAARFRFINEILYTSTGDEAMAFFRDDPELFKVYQDGYQIQANKWPVSPLSVIIATILKHSWRKVVADFGCGDAKLAQNLPNKVYSFDLVALNENVIVCNMEKVPLANASVDIAVFCLSLMGKNLQEYIMEANRVLKKGGLLLIAEVESRFDDSVGSGLTKFITGVRNLGFKIYKKDISHKFFVFLEFEKNCDVNKRSCLPEITLKPCLYKKR